MIIRPPEALRDPSPAVAPLRAMLTPQQEQAVSDPAEYVSMLVARRAGKTFVCVVKCLEVGFTTEFGDIIYVALTKKQAKDIVWPTFRKFNEKFNLGLKFNETLSEITFPGQTKIRLFGGDRIAEIDRLRGQSFNLVVIDEGKSYNPDTLHELIDDVIDPGLGDYHGQLFLIGTPGHIYTGPFYEATTGVDKGYGYGNQFSPHTWTLKDNVAMPHLWERALKKKKQKGWDDNSSTWVREYLGQWSLDEKLFVLNFDKTKHFYDELPQYAYHNILAVKLEASGNFYLNCLAYSKRSPQLYQTYDYIGHDLGLTEISNVIKDVTTKFGTFQSRVALTDSEFSRTLLDRFNMRHRFALKPVNTDDTRSLIELANADLRDNRILCNRESKMAAQELQYLQWEDKSKTAFGDGLQSGLTECFVHGWREAYHHFYREPAGGPEKGSVAWFEKHEEEMFKVALKDEKRQEYKRKHRPWFTHEITRKPDWLTKARKARIRG